MNMLYNLLRRIIIGGCWFFFIFCVISCVISLYIGIKTSRRCCLFLGIPKILGLSHIYICYYIYEITFKHVELHSTCSIYISNISLKFLYTTWIPQPIISIHSLQGIIQVIKQLPSTPMCETHRYHKSQSNHDCNITTTPIKIMPSSIVNNKVEASTDPTCHMSYGLLLCRLIIIGFFHFITRTATVSIHHIQWSFNLQLNDPINDDSRQNDIPMVSSKRIIFHYIKYLVSFPQLYNSLCHYYSYTKRLMTISPFNFNQILDEQQTNQHSMHPINHTTHLKHLHFEISCKHCYINAVPIGNLVMTIQCCTDTIDIYCNIGGIRGIQLSNLTNTYSDTLLPKHCMIKKKKQCHRLSCLFNQFSFNSFCLKCFYGYCNSSKQVCLLHPIIQINHCLKLTVPCETIIQATSVKQMFHILNMTFDFGTRYHLKQTTITNDSIIQSPLNIIINMNLMTELIDFYWKYKSIFLMNNISQLNPISDVVCFHSAIIPFEQLTFPIHISIPNLCLQFIERSHPSVALLYITNNLWKLFKIKHALSIDCVLGETTFLIRRVPQMSFTWWRSFLKNHPDLTHSSYETNQPINPFLLITQSFIPSSLFEICKLSNCTLQYMMTKKPVYPYTQHSRVNIPELVLFWIPDGFMTWISFLLHIIRVYRFCRLNVTKTTQTTTQCTQNNNNATRSDTSFCHRQQILTPSLHKESFKHHLNMLNDHKHEIFKGQMPCFIQMKPEDKTLSYLQTVINDLTSIEIQNRETLDIRIGSVWIIITNQKDHQEQNDQPIPSCDTTVIDCIPPYIICHISQFIFHQSPMTSGITLHGSNITFYASHDLQSQPPLHFPSFAHHLFTHIIQPCTSINHWKICWVSETLTIKLLTTATTGRFTFMMQITTTFIFWDVAILHTFWAILEQIYIDSILTKRWSFLCTRDFIVPSSGSGTDIFISIGSTTVQFKNYLQIQLHRCHIYKNGQQSLIDLMSHDMTVKLNSNCILPLIEMKSVTLDEFKKKVSRSSTYFSPPLLFIQRIRWLFDSEEFHWMSVLSDMDLPASIKKNIPSLNQPTVPSSLFKSIPSSKCHIIGMECLLIPEYYYEAFKLMYYEFMNECLSQIYIPNYIQLFLKSDKTDSLFSSPVSRLSIDIQSFSIGYLYNMYYHIPKNQSLCYLKQTDLYKDDADCIQYLQKNKYQKPFVKLITGSPFKDVIQHPYSSNHGTALTNRSPVPYCHKCCQTFFTTDVIHHQLTETPLTTNDRSTIYSSLYTKHSPIQKTFVNKNDIIAGSSETHTQFKDEHHVNCVCHKNSGSTPHHSLYVKYPVIPLNIEQYDDSTVPILKSVLGVWEQFGYPIILLTVANVSFYRQYPSVLFNNTFYNTLTQSNQLFKIQEPPIQDQIIFYHLLLLTLQTYSLSIRQCQCILGAPTSSLTQRLLPFLSVTIPSFYMTQTSAHLHHMDYEIFSNSKVISDYLNNRHWIRIKCHFSMPLFIEITGTFLYFYQIISSLFIPLLFLQMTLTKNKNDNKPKTDIHYDPIETIHLDELPTISGNIQMNSKQSWDIQCSSNYGLQCTWRLYGHQKTTDYICVPMFNLIIPEWTFQLFNEKTPIATELNLPINLLNTFLNMHLNSIQQHALSNFITSDIYFKYMLSFINHFRSFNVLCQLNNGLFIIPSDSSLHYKSSPSLIIQQKSRSAAYIDFSQITCQCLCIVSLGQLNQDSNIFMVNTHHPIKIHLNGTIHFHGVNILRNKGLCHSLKGVCCCYNHQQTNHMCNLNKPQIVNNIFETSYINNTSFFLLHPLIPLCFPQSFVSCYTEINCRPTSCAFCRIPYTFNLHPEGIMAFLQCIQGPIIPMIPSNIFNRLPTYKSSEQSKTYNASWSQKDIQFKEFILTQLFTVVKFKTNSTIHAFHLYSRIGNARCNIARFSIQNESTIKLMNVSISTCRTIKTMTPIQNEPVPVHYYHPYTLLTFVLNHIQSVRSMTLQSVNLGIEYKEYHHLLTSQDIYNCKKKNHLQLNIFETCVLHGIYLSNMFPMPSPPEAHSKILPIIRVHLIIGELENLSDLSIQLNEMRILLNILTAPLILQCVNEWDALRPISGEFFQQMKRDQRIKDESDKGQCIHQSYLNDSSIKQFQFHLNCNDIQINTHWLNLTQWNASQNFKQSSLTDDFLYRDSRFDTTKIHSFIVPTQVTPTEEMILSKFKLPFLSHFWTDAIIPNSQTLHHCIIPEPKFSPFFTSKLHSYLTLGVHSSITKTSRVVIHPESIEPLLQFDIAWILATAICGLNDDSIKQLFDQDLQLSMVLELLHHNSHLFGFKLFRHSSSTDIKHQLSLNKTDQYSLTSEDFRHFLLNIVGDQGLLYIPPIHEMTTSSFVSSSSQYPIQEDFPYYSTRTHNVNKQRSCMQIALGSRLETLFWDYISFPKISTTSVKNYHPRELDHVSWRGCIKPSDACQLVVFSKGLTIRLIIDINSTALFSTYPQHLKYQSPWIQSTTSSSYHLSRSFGKTYCMIHTQPFMGHTADLHLNGLLWVEPSSHTLDHTAYSSTDYTLHDINQLPSNNFNNENSVIDAIHRSYPMASHSLTSNTTYSKHLPFFIGKERTMNLLKPILRTTCLSSQIQCALPILSDSINIRLTVPVAIFTCTSVSTQQVIQLVCMILINSDLLPMTHQTKPEHSQDRLLSNASLSTAQPLCPHIVSQHDPMPTSPIDPSFLLKQSISDRHDLNGTERSLESDKQQDISHAPLPIPTAHESIPSLGNHQMTFFKKTSSKLAGTQFFSRLRHHEEIQSSLELLPKKQLRPSMFDRHILRFKKKYTEEGVLHPDTSYTTLDFSDNVQSISSPQPILSQHITPSKELDDSIDIPNQSNIKTTLKVPNRRQILKLLLIYFAQENFKQQQYDQSLNTTYLFEETIKDDQSQQSGLSIISSDTDDESSISIPEEHININVPIDHIISSVQDSIHQDERHENDDPLSHSSDQEFMSIPKMAASGQLDDLIKHQMANQRTNRNPSSHISEHIDSYHPIKPIEKNYQEIDPPGHCHILLEYDIRQLTFSFVKDDWIFCRLSGTNISGSLKQSISLQRDTHFKVDIQDICMEAVPPSRHSATTCDPENIKHSSDKEEPDSSIDHLTNNHNTTSIRPGLDLFFPREINHLILSPLYIDQEACSSSVFTFRGFTRTIRLVASTQRFLLKHHNPYDITVKVYEQLFLQICPLRVHLTPPLIENLYNFIFPSSIIQSSRQATALVHPTNLPIPHPLSHHEMYYRLSSPMMTQPTLCVRQTSHKKQQISPSSLSSSSTSLSPTAITSTTKHRQFSHQTTPSFTCIKYLHIAPIVSQINYSGGAFELSDVQIHFKTFIQKNRIEPLKKIIDRYLWYLGKQATAAVIRHKLRGWVEDKRKRFRFHTHRQGLLAFGKKIKDRTIYRKKSSLTTPHKWIK